MEKKIVLPGEFLKGIKIIVIDASGIIYLLKTGLLGSLAAEIQLITTTPVFDEVGWPRLPVEQVEIECSGITNDQSLIKLAVERDLPVLSEDLEVLTCARKQALSYYNSLMMLNYLLLKERVSVSEYTDYLTRLKKISHYGDDILDYGTRIFKLIIKSLK